MGEDRRLWWVPTLAAGGLAGLALPPAGLPPLIWASLAVLWSQSASVSKGRCGVAGLLWGWAAVLVSHRWLLWLHPLDWIGVPAPLSLPLCCLLWLLCGLVAGLMVALWCLTVRWLGATRATSAVLAAVLWGLGEIVLARGPLFWIGLGASSLPGDPALAQLARLGGAAGIAFYQVLVGWCLWRLVVARSRRTLVLITLALILGGHAAGLAPAWAAGSGSDGRDERLLLVQPAVPTRRKFEPQSQRLWLRDLEAVQRAHGPDEVDALVLPEGALIQDQPLPRPATAEVLAGGFRWQGEELRSSLLRFTPGERDPHNAVDKHRLVPLGEWVPGAELLRWSGLSAVGGLSPGPASRLLPRPTGAVAATICYEISDGTALAAASRDGARWLLAAANLDPYPQLLQQQYEALARLRSIETGRWLVSAANTGPTLLVDPQGAVRSRLAPGIPSTATVTLHHRSGLTAYDHWGEWPLLFLALVAVLARRWPALREVLPFWTARVTARPPGSGS